MQKYSVVVSKKVDGKYSEVGKVTVFYPLLSEMGFNVEPLATKMNEDGTPVDQGLPVYADDKAQYVFDAVFAAVKADARNKLVTGTADLKPGSSIAETIEELLAAPERNGEALKAYKEMLEAFKTYLTTTGKSVAVQAAILSLAKNKEGLKLQPAEKKAKFLSYINAFAATLNEVQSAAWERGLLAINEAGSAIDALDDM